MGKKGSGMEVVIPDERWSAVFAVWDRGAKGLRLFERRRRQVAIVGAPGCMLLEVYVNGELGLERVDAVSHEAPSHTLRFTGLRPGGGEGEVEVCIAGAVLLDRVDTNYEARTPALPSVPSPLPADESDVLAAVSSVCHRIGAARPFPIKGLTPPASVCGLYTPGLGICGVPVFIQATGCTERRHMLVCVWLWSQPVAGEGPVRRTHQRAWVFVEAAHEAHIRSWPSSQASRVLSAPGLPVGRVDPGSVELPRGVFAAQWDGALAVEAVGDEPRYEAGCCWLL
eukprot:Hpha_TRINITY_DN9608_c0_g1::TRINITY_DN9608_c0_g1_i1::g.184414::m.184414